MSPASFASGFQVFPMPENVIFKCILIINPQLQALSYNATSISPFAVFCILLVDI
jgi:hypothetical protein